MDATLCRAVAATVAIILLLAVPAAGDEGESPPPEVPCYEMVDLNLIRVTCEHSAQSIQSAQAAEPGAVFKVYQLCKDGTSGEAEVCSNPRVCSVGGVTGTLYAVIKNGERDGTACLTAGDAAGIEDPPIRVLVIRTFETLDWNPSELVIQPPGGKTLVNLDTNFYTENRSASSIPVELQGQRVVVTARPIAYRWTFGDGTTRTTTSPGAPYPGLDVAHVYAKTGKVAVSVDTQYGDASFTVNGGAPEAIPSTLWVAGGAEDLAIVEAMPQLVIR